MIRRIMHMFNSRNGRSYDSNEFFAEEREDNKGNGIKLLNDECKAMICKKEEYRDLIDIKKLHNLIEALKREKLAEILRRNIEEYYPYAWNNNDDR